MQQGGGVRRDYLICWAKSATFRGQLIWLSLEVKSDLRFDISDLDCLHIHVSCSYGMGPFGGRAA